MSFWRKADNMALGGMAGPVQDSECDVLVIGSGAAGLACAFAASHFGLNVLVAEKAPVLGGTTAWSGGEIWVPANPYQAAAGVRDSTEEAITYLMAAGKGNADPLRVRAYVEHAAEAVGFYVENGAMAVERLPGSPDYFSDLPGYSSGGRTLRTLPFDGRNLGRDFRLLRDPLPAAQIFGGLSIGREDILHLQSMARSPKSFLHVSGLLAAHAWQRLSGLHRGARTTMGNALIARFQAALATKGVRILLNSAVEEVVVDHDRICVAVINGPIGKMRITAKNGIVLATGGFSHDMQRRKETYPHVARGQQHCSVPPGENTGDGIRLGLSAGGILRQPMLAPAAWTAVSQAPLGRRQTANVPHFGDRAKPGIVAVTRNGQRFANEATNYHDFCASLISACTEMDRAEGFLIADSRSIRRYGLGRVGPFPNPLGPHVGSGYLLKGRTIAELADRAGISQVGLIETIERFNKMARNGRDTDFQRGESDFDRAAGDPDNRPNPCLAPLETGPFFALKIVPGDISTFMGLETDAMARVIDKNGAPIAGLFALGADSASIAAGSYPAAGITLGPAVTFAYLAACAIRDQRSN